MSLVFLFRKIKEKRSKQMFLEAVLQLITKLPFLVKKRKKDLFVVRGFSLNNCELYVIRE